MIGKILYGCIFVVALPLLLIAWARATEAMVALPAWNSFPAGLVLALCGTAVMLAGMLAIYLYGEGLPMNAYPPARFVTQGIYRYLAHPIYSGFSMICVGLAVAAGSSSGLWLVSTSVTLGCVALVQGYEKHDLHKRFGSDLPTPLLRIPVSESAAPSFADRLSAYFLVLCPWLLVREAGRLLEIPVTAVIGQPFGSALAVYPWAAFGYIFGYPFVFLAPLAAATRYDLRRFAASGLFSISIVVLLFIAYPAREGINLLTASGWPGQILVWEQSHSPHSLAMLASFVAWLVIAADLWTASLPQFRWLWYSLALFCAGNGLAGGSLSVIDIILGMGIALIAIRMDWIWKQLRALMERIANSWHEWRVGPVRIINHGIYAGAAAFLGFWMVCTLLGSGHITALWIMAVSILVTSALWAQWIEGSSSLLRPYGWYGGVLGAIFGGLLAIFLGENPWLLFAAFCVAAPWIQSTGRLRCLVQGCCHGSLAPANIGICYTHPRSRVIRLSGLGGVPVHPTPLYSILWNAVIAVITARLWLLQVPASLIIGVYLILSGLGRFVEESYRGEPQTASFGGLRLYQWLAILSVLLGIGISMFNGAPVASQPQFYWGSLTGPLVFAVVACCALGMDFPDSSRRFSRLA